MGKCWGGWILLLPTVMWNGQLCIFLTYCVFHKKRQPTKAWYPDSCTYLDLIIAFGFVNKTVANFNHCQKSCGNISFLCICVSCKQYISLFCNIYRTSQYWTCVGFIYFRNWKLKYFMQFSGWSYTKLENLIANDVRVTCKIQ